MAPNLVVTEATQADLPTIVALTCAAMEPDVLNHFLYGPRRAEAVRKESELLMTSLGQRFKEPTNRCHIIKATDKASDKIVAWSLIRWEDGSWPLGTTEKSSTFAGYYQNEVKKNWAKLIARRPHVVLGALHVRPDFQGQGIGRKMIEYLDAKYGLKRELVIVQTRAMSEAFYLKLGWTTISSTDVDLAKFAGPGRGYGVHRSPQMVRRPASE